MNRRTPKLVLVEGPDGAGKTTLISQIVKSMFHDSVFVGSCGVPEESPMKEYLHKAIEGWYDRKDVVIFDRFHIGEQVYGPIMRGKNGLGSLKRNVLEGFLAELFDPVIVLARPPFEACREVWSERREDEYVPDEDRMLRVWEAFGDIKTNLAIVAYDRTCDNVDRLMRRLGL